MTDKITIARPYAKAAFEYASEQKAIPVWEQLLHAAAQCVADPHVAMLIKDPRLTTQQKTEIITGVCETLLDDERRNFLKILGDNHRLYLLDEIAALFTSYRAESQKLIKVDITSAFQIPKAQQEKLTQALHIHLQREIELSLNIDENLLGGAVIRAGDFVIDGSVKGQLNRLGRILEDRT